MRRRSEKRAAEKSQSAVRRGQSEESRDESLEGDHREGRQRDEPVLSTHAQGLPVSVRAGSRFSGDSTEGPFRRPSALERSRSRRERSVSISSSDESEPTPGDWRDQPGTSRVTDEAMKAAAKRDAARRRKAKSRQSLSENEQEEVKRKDRERKAQKRASQTEEQRVRTRSSDKNRKAESRASQSDEERANSNEFSRLGMHRYRDSLSDDARDIIRQTDASRKQSERNSMDVMERAQYNEASAIRMQVVRDEMSDEEYEEYLEGARARKQTKMAAKWAPFKLAAVLNEEGNLRNSDVEQHNLGLRDKICGHCRAVHYGYETGYKVKKAGSTEKVTVYSDCCSKGTIDVAMFTAFARYPEQLKELFRIQSGNSSTVKRLNVKRRNFRKNIRRYNSALAMASLGYKRVAQPGRGPQVFKVQGAVYHFTHKIEDLREGQLAQFNQCWLLATGQAMEHRVRQSPVLNMEVLNEIKAVLNGLNPFYGQYKTMYELAQEQNLTEFAIRFYKNRGDRGTHNLPTSNEIVAALCNGDETTARGAYVYKSDGAQEHARTFIKYSEPTVDSLTYPLIDPLGQLPGWDPNLRGGIGPNSKKVTLMHYYSAVMSEREGEFNPAIMTGELADMFGVDAGSKIDTNRLEYLAQNQRSIQAERLGDLQDFLDAAEDHDYGMRQQLAEMAASNLQDSTGARKLDNVGMFKKLPASFRGGPRYNKRNYYNSMSMVGALGKPCMFITMTCNPEWLELENLMVDGIVPMSNRPKACKVFEGKVKQLLDEIDKGQIFGKCAGFTGVVEFQKRGLPHLHLLVFLESGDKLITPERVDKVVSAEIPDISDDPVLHALVKKFMLHRKCGPANPSAPCMREAQTRRTTRARAQRSDNAERAAAESEAIVRQALDDDIECEELDELIAEALDKRARLQLQAAGFEHAEEVLDANNVFEYDDMMENGQDDVDDVNVAEEESGEEMEVEQHLSQRLSQGLRISQAARDSVSQEDNGQTCGKRFPKPFCAHTNLTNRFPKYRRRENDENGLQMPTITIKKRSFVETYNNQWVVPYNAYLLKRFNCHINVEVVASSSQACRYLFAYIHKGDDMSNIAFRKEGGERDEIKAYAETKCIAPNEAYFTIFSLKIYYISHTIVQLDVHLPNRQIVFFQNDGMAAAARDGDRLWTMLTAFFELNKWCADVFNDDYYELFVTEKFNYTFVYNDRNGNRQTQTVRLPIDSRRFLYHEIPKYFVFHKENKGLHYWDTRKKGDGYRTLGRMFHIRPSKSDDTDRDRYYLRMLLLHVRGPTSFESLRTLDNGDVVPTFKEACRRRNLLESDRGHEECLEEAARAFTSHQLRHLFIMILSTDEVTDCPSLYDKFKDKMYEDYRNSRVRKFTVAQAEERLYLTMEQIGREYGIEFSSFVVRPDDYADNVEDHLAHVEEQNVRQEMRDMGNWRIGVLNQGQRAGYDLIMRNLQKADDDPEKKRLFFIDGPAGTGKTFLYKTLYYMATGEYRKKALCVAYSGVAAFLLPEGQTCHSAFKLKFDMNEDEYGSSMRYQEAQADKLRAVDLIIWDEVSMAPKWALSAVDELLRWLTGNLNVPFGGKTLVIGGDFRQVLPVIKKGSRRQVFEACMKRHPLWRNFAKIALTQNVRCAHRAFQERLLAIGNGLVGRDEEPLYPNGSKVFPVESSLLLTGELESLINFVYDEATLSSPERLASSCILAPTNAEVDRICKRVLYLMMRSNGRERPMACYSSFDKLLPDTDMDENVVSIDFLNRENPPGFPPHQLELEKGCIVTLIRNISVSQGLTNGTRLIVERFLEHSILCKVVASTGDQDQDQYVVIPRIPFVVDADATQIGVTFTRRQFPLRLSFAMTINKSQGQTFQKVGLYLERSVFSHGHLYVAMSRVTDPANLRILSPTNQITNVVWAEVLDRQGEENMEE